MQNSLSRICRRLWLSAHLHSFFELELPHCSTSLDLFKEVAWLGAWQLLHSSTPAKVLAGFSESGPRIQLSRLQSGGHCNFFDAPGLTGSGEDCQKKSAMKPCTIKLAGNSTQSSGRSVFLYLGWPTKSLNLILQQQSICFLSSARGLL